LSTNNEYQSMIYVGEQGFQEAIDFVAVTGIG